MLWSFFVLFILRFDVDTLWTGNFSSFCQFLLLFLVIIEMVSDSAPFSTHLELKLGHWVINVTTFIVQLWPQIEQYSLLLLLTGIVFSLESCAAYYASCWPKMTIDCSATTFVIRLGWILHLNHFIIYVPNSCQCHLEAGWLVIHHTLSFTVVINIVMGWTFTMKLPGDRNADLFGRVKIPKTGQHKKHYDTSLQPDSLFRDVASVAFCLLCLILSSLHCSILSSYMATQKKYRTLLSFSIRTSIITCQSSTSLDRHR